MLKGKVFRIEQIKDKIRNGDTLFSKHAEQERQNDRLTITEVIESLLNGMILEQYPDTGRGASCLIAGFTDKGKPVHSVCGERKGKVVLITVYVPMPPRFRNVHERESV